MALTPPQPLAAMDGLEISWLAHHLLEGLRTPSPVTIRLAALQRKD
jgi:hypothetical protein